MATHLRNNLYKFVGKIFQRGREREEKSNKNEATQKTAKPICLFTNAVNQPCQLGVCVWLKEEEKGGN